MKFYDLNKMKNSRIFFDQNPPRFIKYFILLVCLLVVVGLVLAIYVKKNYIVNVEGKVIFENTEYVISNVNGSIGTRKAKGRKRKKVRAYQTI